MRLISVHDVIWMMLDIKYPTSTDIDSTKEGGTRSQV